MASFHAFVFCLGEQNKPIQNLVSEVLTGNETLIETNRPAFNQVAQKYLPSTVGIESKDIGKHQKFVILMTDKCLSELKLDVVLKLKVLEQNDPLYFGLNLSGEVTARPEPTIYSGPMPPEGILLEFTKEYKITIRVTNWNAPSAPQIQGEGITSTDLSSSDSEKVQTSQVESGYDTKALMTMTHDGTGDFKDGIDPILAGPELQNLTISLMKKIYKNYKMFLKNFKKMILY